MHAGVPGIRAGVALPEMHTGAPGMRTGVPGMRAGVPGMHTVPPKTCLLSRTQSGYQVATEYLGPPGRGWDAYGCARDVRRCAREAYR